jgi:hypothetical protein
MEYKMNMDEVFGMLTNKIAEASYKARITEYLANIGFDSDGMRRESNTLYEHAFAWIEVQNAMSGTENGDDVYREAQRDASGEILQARNLYANRNDAIRVLMAAAGYSGEAINTKIAFEDASQFQN